MTRKEAIGCHRKSTDSSHSCVSPSLQTAPLWFTFMMLCLLTAAYHTAALRARFLACFIELCFGPIVRITAECWWADVEQCRGVASFEWSVLHRRSPLGTVVPLPERNHPSLSPISLLAASWLGHDSGARESVVQHEFLVLNLCYGWSRSYGAGKAFSNPYLEPMHCERWPVMHSKSFQARLDFREQDMTVIGLTVGCILLDAQ